MRTVKGSEPLRAWHGYTMAVYAQELLGTMAALSMSMIESGHEAAVRAGLTEAIEEIKGNQE